MEITEVRLRRSLRDSKVLANASIVFDGQFVVHDIRIVQGSQGPFVSMPSRRTQTGDYLDVAHPLTAEYRAVVQEKVLAAYEAWRKSNAGGPAGGVP
ncbi:MAG: septation protein SpoVG family protein, partial [Dactylosporangium sp.]|nr:septation protein SpoVG family protein [Dactylosporangium sp.]